MKFKIYYLFILCAFGCNGQASQNKNAMSNRSIEEPDSSEIQKYYALHQNLNERSVSLGSVSKGSLENGRLLPFKGENYSYFDTLSYLSGRAFLHEKVLSSVIELYDSLTIATPHRNYQIMECSNQKGGKMAPHRTHQNGMSIDFMTPLKQNNIPYYELDNLGSAHYLLDFDENGNYQMDSSVSIDFETMAQHILILNEVVKKYNLKINKIIFKIELKDELFSGFYGNKLMKSGIYITQNLTPLINGLHDDHYHIDFEVLD